MDSLNNFTPQQQKMVAIAGRLWWAVADPLTKLPAPSSLPDLERLCCHWYMEISPTIPLYSVMLVYNWLKETGYYNPYGL